MAFDRYLTPRNSFDIRKQKSRMMRKHKNSHSVSIVLKNLRSSAINVTPQKSRETHIKAKDMRISLLAYND